MGRKFSRLEAQLELSLFSLIEGTSRELWGRPDCNHWLREMDPAQQSMLVEEFLSVTSSSPETARELLQVNSEHTLRTVEDPAVI